MIVGIIGGGIGGLAVAWNLSVVSKGAIKIHVFEAQDRFGGNADTKHFDFGTGPGSEDKPLQRWCDMGVNDFNIPAYQNIVKIMDHDLKFKKGVNYRNLEDSTTYYTNKGHAITANSQPNGKPDPWWGTAMPDDLRASVDGFMKTASADADDQKFHDYTMEQYIDEQSKHNGWVAALGPEVIYPRINGMYFTSSVTGPRKMPFAAVMHYYKIQEGGGGTPDRNYFVGGASTWIDALVDYMKAHMPEITFHTGFKACAAYDGGTATCHVKNMTKGSTETVDVSQVVLALPADEALKAVAPTDNSEYFGLSQAQVSALAKVKYETAISVAHTDTRLLPVNRNAWSTYNIVIHEPGAVALKPYVINYVCNRHQNDAANPDFNKFGMPEFFLSINPHIPVAEDKVLIDHKTNKPAMANLKHFVFDFDCMQAQAEILPLQGLGGLFFASGWTYGSGLHTECWSQGEAVATMIYKVYQNEQKHVAVDAVPQAELITSRLTASANGQQAKA